MEDGDDEDEERGVGVECNGVSGRLLPGGRRGEEFIRMNQDGEMVTVAAQEFEVRAGLGHRKKWKDSVTVTAPADDDDNTDDADVVEMGGLKVRRTTRRTS